MVKAILQSGEHFQEVQAQGAINARIWADRTFVKPEPYLNTGYQVSLYFDNNLVGWFHVDVVMLDGRELGPERMPAKAITT